MQATEQQQLLRSMEVSTVMWTDLPAFVVMCIGGPILALVNYCALVIAGTYGLSIPIAVGNLRAKFVEQVSFDVSEAFWEHNFNGCQGISCGIQGYPPFILVYRSLGFMLAIFFSITFTLHFLHPATSPKNIAPNVSNAVSNSVMAVLAMEGFFGYILYTSLDFKLFLK